MKANVAQRRNSRRVRKPKVSRKKTANHPRAEWDAAFAKMAQRGDDALLDAPINRRDL